MIKDLEIFLTKERIIEQEKKLQFQYFSNALAYDIANKILDKIKKQGLKAVRIQISYKEEIIFYYLMDGKSKSKWLERKTKTVIDSGHSSLYTMFDDNYRDWRENPNYCTAGGAFPIIENHQVKGAIAVSGLEHWEDHQIIIEVLEEILESEK
ncbi:MAG: heme-binding protein [Lactovum sp.]